MTGEGIVLQSLIREGFALRPSLAGRTLRIVFTGCADSEAEPLLDDYFMRIHTEALRAQVAEAVVDVHEVYFINSSCFKALINWIGLSNGAGANQRYRIRFQKDPLLRWQARSFDALHRMNPALVVIEDWAGGKQ